MPRTANRTNSKSSPPPPKPAIRPPSPIAPAPSPMPIQRSSNSMMDTMKQGFAFGIGSSIAHNLFDSKPNSKNENENKTINKNEITNEPKLTTDKMYELYNKCLENNDRNIDCTIILQNNK
jgi:hypothetical protein